MNVLSFDYGNSNFHQKAGVKECCEPYTWHTVSIRATLLVSKFSRLDRSEISACSQGVLFVLIGRSKDLHTRRPRVIFQLYFLKYFVIIRLILILPKKKNSVKKKKKKPACKYYTIFKVEYIGKI